MILIFQPPLTAVCDLQQAAGISSVMGKGKGVGIFEGQPNPRENLVFPDGAPTRPLGERDTGGALLLAEGSFGIYSWDNPSSGLYLMKKERALAPLPSQPKPSDYRSK